MTVTVWGVSKYKLHSQSYANLELLDIGSCSRHLVLGWEFLFQAFSSLSDVAESTVFCRPLSPATSIIIYIHKTPEGEQEKIASL